MAPEHRIITLTTDFGMSDGYVGIVKGVILSINPDVTFVDVSHEVPAWDIAAAAWVIWNTHRHFVRGTIHLCVVDPMVGAETQRGVAIARDDAIFVGPDNGIFSHIVREPESARCYELANHDYWRAEVSSTFHTRDIYGPVCAHLSLGVPASNLGPEVAPATIKQIALPEFSRSQDSLDGSIVYLDKFGNLVSNIPGIAVEKGQYCYLDGRLIGQVATTYANAEKGHPAVFIGSHGFLEIGIYQASARSAFGAGVGTKVHLEPRLW